MIEIIFDGCVALLEWWSPEGAEIVKELGSDPSGTIDNPWCG